MILALGVLKEFLRWLDIGVVPRGWYSANPKKDWISVFDVGSGRVDIRDLLSVVINLFVGVKRTPR